MNESGHSSRLAAPMEKTVTRRKPKSQFPLTPALIVLGGIVLVVIALWINASSTTAGSPADLPEGQTDPEVERVSVQEAKAAFDVGTALIVDVRSANSYRESHAEGAISLPSAEIAARYQELPQDKLLYLYCT